MNSELCDAEKLNLKPPVEVIGTDCNEHETC